MGGDLHEVLAVEPVANIQVRRDSEHKCKMQNAKCKH
jgi:hypothetical protein